MRGVDFARKARNANAMLQSNFYITDSKINLESKAVTMKTAAENEKRGEESELVRTHPNNARDYSIQFD